MSRFRLYVPNLNLFDHTGIARSPPMWILMAIGGYLLTAFSQTSDKYLLGRPAVQDPRVLAFWLTSLSFFVIFLFPFGLTWPGLHLFFIDLAAGFTFFLSILTFYYGLSKNEASRAVPIVGGLTPIVVLILSHLLLQATFKAEEWAGFFLLVTGGVLASFDGKHGVEGITIKGIRFLALAIITTGVYMVFIKYLYIQQGFLDAFVWSRVGASLAGATLLLSTSFRKKVFSNPKQKERLGVIFLAANVAAGVGEIMVNLAISRTNVALITALRGTEYVFVFVIASLLAKKRPDLLGEETEKRTIIHKAIAIGIIVIGLVLLFL